MNRRKFGSKLLAVASSLGLSGGVLGRLLAEPKKINGQKKLYGMGIQIEKCIGCARCAEACKEENDVPKEPFFYRTWIERYILRKNGKVEVQKVDNTQKTSTVDTSGKDIMRTFFVPKLCNQCDHPPCVQVCPVGATFKTEDGVILIDDKRCIGCRYCVQACPYGARYMHPEKETADKCTFCYHRLRKDLLPACVEVCPTQARIFGDLHSNASPLVRFRRMNKLHVLKPGLNTEPKVMYSNLDGEVR